MKTRLLLAVVFVSGGVGGASEPPATADGVTELTV